jgi:alpha-L-fucosidase 2
MWARFGEGDRALSVIGNLLKYKNGAHDAPPSPGGGLYANLFDAHPPFQIDGNYGVTAGIAEMLLQSRMTNAECGTVVIDLLPALPAAWAQGHVRGLCARGGFEVDMDWAQGRLQRVEIVSKSGNPCELRYGGKRVVVELAAGERRVVEAPLVVQPLR